MIGNKIFKIDVEELFMNKALDSYVEEHGLSDSVEVKPISIKEELKTARNELNILKTDNDNLKRAVEELTYDKKVYEKEVRGYQQKVFLLKDVLTKLKKKLNNIMNIMDEDQS